MNYTRKEYEQYLNDCMPSIGEHMIIGGKMRKGEYGTMIRRYDPIAFEVGFNEWITEKK